AMDEKRWPDVRRLFEAAVELPAERREAFLHDACAGDAELRSLVGSLLAADAGGDDRLDVAPPPLDLLRSAAPPEATTPAQIGAYRVLEEVGRGGMGVVYRAERADGAFERAVALKVIRAGFDSD